MTAKSTRGVTAHDNHVNINNNCFQPRMSKQTFSVAAADPPAGADPAGTGRNINAASIRQR